jgi:hypothetical protein
MKKDQELKVQKLKWGTADSSSGTLGMHRLKSVPLAAWK